MNTKKHTPRGIRPFTEVPPTVLPRAPVQDVPVADIVVGERHRKDMGDITALASSIERLGLLQPVGLDSNHTLIFGERRLTAFEQLGRTTIPAHIINVPSLLLAEHDENVIRKEFTPSERVAIGQAVEAEIGNRQGQRTDKLVANLPEVEPGKRTRDIAAEKAGFDSTTTYRQAKTVVENAEPELTAAMDREDIAISTAAMLATAPAEVQIEAAADPAKAVDLAKQARGKGFTDEPPSRPAATGYLKSHGAQAAHLAKVAKELKLAVRENSTRPTAEILALLADIRASAEKLERGIGKFQKDERT